MAGDSRGGVRVIAGDAPCQGQNPTADAFPCRQEELPGAAGQRRHEEVPPYAAREGSAAKKPQVTACAAGRREEARCDSARHCYAAQSVRRREEAECEKGQNPWEHPYLGQNPLAAAPALIGLDSPNG